MKTKTVSMPLPSESAGGQPVKVSERSSDYVSETVAGAFSRLFSETESVKCIMVKVNGVLNLQFIGNGCVANLQIAEVSSQNTLEPYVPSSPILLHINTGKGGNHV